MLDMQKIGIRLIHIDENQLSHLENKLKGKKTQNVFWFF